MTGMGGRENNCVKRVEKPWGVGGEFAGIAGSVGYGAAELAVIGKVVKKRGFSVEFGAQTHGSETKRIGPAGQWHQMNANGCSGPNNGAG